MPYIQEKFKGDLIIINDLPLNINEKGHHEALMELYDKHEGPVFSKLAKIAGYTQYIYETSLSNNRLYPGLYVCVSNNKKIGEMYIYHDDFGVFLLDEVLKINPNFDVNFESPWYDHILIKDFDGYVNYIPDDKNTKIEGIGMNGFVLLQENKNIKTVSFKGDIIITDPCYIDTEDDLLWKDDKNQLNVLNGRGLTKFGFTNYIWESTLYGDWSCTTVEKTKKVEKFFERQSRLYYDYFINYNNDSLTKKEKEVLQTKYESCIAKFKSKLHVNVLGHFCADSGLVGVFLLDEVLKFNPNFNHHLTKPHTTTLIKKFDGEVSYIVENNKARLEGNGNINFITNQTGF